MRVTLQPETYSASSVTVKVSMSLENEQELMNAAGAVQTVQGIISLFEAIVGKR